MATEAPPTLDDGMGVLVDLTKCNGCRQCEAACKEAAGFEVPTKEELLDESVFLKHRRPGPRSYTTVNRFAGQDEQRQEAAIFVKANCFHCLDPACVSACLVGAMRRQPNGAVTYDASKCMGCRYCMVACPFQIPTYEYDNVFTPAVRKCTFCCDEGNPNKGGIPACVRACPRQCLIYGKRSNLLLQAHDRIRRYPDNYVDHVYGEHEAGGTSWLFVSGVPFEKLGFLSVGHQAPPRLSESIQHGVFNYFIPPVAWAGLLGLAMWLTRPESKHLVEAQSAEDQEHLRRGDAAQPAQGRQRKGVPA
jgi:Fe-S-cluster-containing dehydrogenase component